MSEYSLDEPGFAPPVPPVPPSSSESSVETPVDGRRKCIACPRRMSKKSADRHTLCITCRGFDCDLNNRCEECLEWSEEEVVKYAKYRKSLKSRESSFRAKSSVPTPPLTPSGPSPQPAPRPAQRDDIESQVDSLAMNFQSLSDNLTSQLTDFMSQFLSHTQSSRQPWLGPDAGESYPGRTAGESRMFQGEGAPSRMPLVPPSTSYPLPRDFRALLPEQSGRATPRSPPFAAPRASARQAPRPPPGFAAPPQPSTSGWVPSGPPPPRSRHDSSASDSEASEGESVTSARDSASARLADLIYEVCPDLALSSMRRLHDAVLRPGSASLRLRPLSSASDCILTWLRYRRRWLLGRRLWLAVPSHCRVSSLRAYALADDAVFASSQPVNSAFSQLAGSRALGSRRWGSVTFSDMERLERLFQGQLEVTSSSLWLMSGILAMLKRDHFQPSDPALFNSALSSVSAALSRQARTAAAGSGFLRAKRRESLLAHTSLPVPETQKRSLTVTPGSSSGLFDAELLSEVVSQVQSSSQISSNLALSRSLRRGRSASSSTSSPLTGPRLSSFLRGRPYGMRSSSSSRSGGRERFRGGKGGAPSSGPSGFRR